MELKFNVPYAIIMKMLSQPSYQSYSGMLMMMAPSDWGLFVTKTARELIWKYEVNQIQNSYTHFYRPLISYHDQELSKTLSLGPSVQIDQKFWNDCYLQLWSFYWNEQFGFKSLRYWNWCR